MEASMEKNITNTLSTAVKVITNPVGFYRDMPKTGGFVEPLIFAVILGVVSGVLNAILSIFGIGMANTFIMAIASIIIMPILVAIFSFVGAAIIFIIWRIMGSQESYETAYRCGAYACAISPFTTLLGIIPYLGSILGLIWMFYLLVIASTEVHKIAQKTAFMVFGIICFLLVIMSTCGQIASKKMQKGMEKWQTEMEDMTPEEAGRAFGDFMKGLQEATDKGE